MSQHPSFKGASKHARHRSVLKRGERVKVLEKDGKWAPQQSIFGLPKVKTLKLKLKKEKAAVEETAAGTEGVAAPEKAAAGETAAGAKGAPAKGAPAKSAAKTKTSGKEKSEKK